MRPDDVTVVHVVITSVNSGNLALNQVSTSCQKDKNRDILYALGFCDKTLAKLHT